MKSTIGLTLLFTLARVLLPAADDKAPIPPPPPPPSTRTTSAASAAPAAPPSPALFNPEQSNRFQLLTSEQIRAQQEIRAATAETTNLRYEVCMSAGFLAGECGDIIKLPNGSLAVQRLPRPVPATSTVPPPPPTPPAPTPVK